MNYLKSYLLKRRGCSIIQFKLSILKGETSKWTTLKPTRLMSFYINQPSILCTLLEGSECAFIFIILMSKKEGYLIFK